MTYQDVPRHLPKLDTNGLDGVIFYYFTSGI